MRIILIFTIIISLVSFGVCAQDYSKIDSLKMIISKTKQDTIKSKVYLEIGCVFEHSIPDSALFYYRKSLKILTITDKKNDIAKCFENIGNIFYNKSDYDKSFEYYQKSLNINSSIDNKSGIANNLGNIGNIYITKSVYDSALIYYQKVLEYQKDINNDNILALTYINIGIVYDNLTNYKKAIDYCDKSLMIYKSHNNKFGMAHNYLELSILYNKQGFYNKAIYNANKGLELSKIINNLYLQKDIYSSLSDIYKEFNQYFKALEYKDSTNILNDSIFNIEKTLAIAEMDVRYESEKKEKQIIQQQAELKNNQLEIERQQNQRIFFIIVLVLIIVFLALVFFSLKQKIKENVLLRKQKDKLFAAEKKLRQNNEQLDTTNENIESQNKNIKEKNYELLAIEEELRQNNEELLATRDLLEEQKNIVIAKNKDLQEIHDEYKQILDSNSDRILIIDITGKIIYANNQFGVSFLGYSAKDLIGRRVTYFTPLSDIPKHLKRIKKIFLQKRVDTFESVGVHKEGVYVPIEVSGKVVKYKGKTVVIGTLRNITDRKIREQTIKEKTKKYELLTKAIGDFVWMIDLKLQNIYISPSCEQLTGYTEEEVEEIGIVSLHTLTSTKLLKQAVTMLLANSNKHIRTSTILEYLHENGSIIKSEVTVHLVYNDKGKSIGFAGISRKI